jgi:NhaA family Na+:H+ antiporter
VSGEPGSLVGTTLPTSPDRSGAVTVKAPRRARLFPNLTAGEDTFIGDLLRRETVGGAIALAAAALAVVWANSPWAPAYEALRHLELGPLDVEHWAADGALTLFFFVAGLELKREFVVGSLRRPADAAVPVVAAACGVAVPAAIFLAFNLGSADGHPQGWAVPAATDIAFALAVLAVVGSNLPNALRAFLLTLAVVDDLIVIVIIAVFYTETLDPLPLGLAIAAMVLWAVLQRLRVRSAVLYVPLAVTTWWLVHDSGVHATIAGVALGLLTRVRPDPHEDHSPAERLEHRLSPLSAGVAVPFFALMSAGVVISGGSQLVREPVVLGVALGLVVGKPVGVFGGVWLLTRFTGADLDSALGYRDVVGVAVLAGIGFTVSLLVADLSFDGDLRDAAKTAVLAGSLVSAVAGALILGHRDRFRVTP